MPSAPSLLLLSVATPSDDDDDDDDGYPIPVTRVSNGKGGWADLIL